MVEVKCKENLSLMLGAVKIDFEDDRLEQVCCNVGAPRNSE